MPLGVPTVCTQIARHPTRFAPASRDPPFNLGRRERCLTRVILDGE